MKWLLYQHKEDSEKRHVVDTLNLLIFICLLILTILTVWLLKKVKLRFVHETGLSIVYGLIVGAIIKFSSPHHLPPMLVDSISPRVGGHNYTSHSPIIDPLSLAPNDLSQSEVIEIDAYEPILEDEAQFNSEVFFNVLLPPIIFHAGYNMNKKLFFKNIGLISSFALIGTLISSFITALIVFAGLYIFKYNWAFIDCLKFGAIISATDPVSVLAIFTDLQVDEDLYALVFGESMMNDAVAIVLVSTVSAYKAEAEGFDIIMLMKSAGHFFVVFFGACALGCTMAAVTALMTKFTHLRDYPILETSLFLLMSYATFLAAESVQITGIVALLFCGICQAHYTYKNLSPESKARTKEVFELINFLMENFVFLYIGVATFTFHKHIWNIPFIAFAFLAIVLGRACNVYPISAIANLINKNTVSCPFQHFMLFGGLRGAMAFALSIRETGTTIDCTIFSTTLIIVGTTILLSGAFTEQTLNGLGIKMGGGDEGQDAPPEPGPRRGEYNEIHLHEQVTGSFIFRLWHKIDHKFMKPLLTNYRPSLRETMPVCCLPIAILFTSRKQSQPLGLESAMETDQLPTLNSQAVNNANNNNNNEDIDDEDAINTNNNNNNNDIIDDDDNNNLTTNQSAVSLKVILSGAAGHSV